MKTAIRISLASLALACAAGGAHAQSQQFTIQNGKFTQGSAPKGGLQIGQEQQLMLTASQKVMQQDYTGALAIYDQVIAINGANTQAYIQRSVIKREIKDTAGSRNDAQMAVHLAETMLQRDQNNPRLYHQRGMGYRLMGDFPKARENIQYAIQLAGNKRHDWKTDLDAVNLEEKMN